MKYECIPDDMILLKVFCFFRQYIRICAQYTNLPRIHITEITLPLVRHCMREFLKFEQSEIRKEIFFRRFTSVRRSLRAYNYVTFLFVITLFY